jgi:pyridoxamine 5'-phosphate oxidase
MSGAGGVREMLRAIPVFAGELPEFDVEAAPERPEELFLSWLHEALDAGVREPHAMTLSTVDEQGVPSARVLILKNVDADGWQFAVHADSPKGRELAGRAAAALTFYWPAQARQIRVKGPVTPAPAEQSAADFLARSLPARAKATLGRQSTPLATLRGQSKPPTTPGGQSTPPATLGSQSTSAAALTGEYPAGELRSRVAEAVGEVQAALGEGYVLPEWTEPATPRPEPTTPWAEGTTSGPGRFSGPSRIPPRARPLPREPRAPSPESRAPRPEARAPRPEAQRPRCG